jgi:hypothetical protein
MVQLQYRDGRVIFSWLWNEHDITDIFSFTEMMEPYYAMEPNIG